MKKIFTNHRVKISLIILGLLCCISIGLFGCASTTSSTTQSDSAKDQSISTTADETYISLEEAIQSEGVFVLKDNNAFMSTLPFSEDEDSPFSLEEGRGDGNWICYSSNFSNPEKEELSPNKYTFISADNVTTPYISLSPDQGNQLIAVGENATACTVYQVVKEGYWPGFSVNIWGPGHTHNPEYPVSGVAVNGEDIDIAEINGVDVTNPDNSNSSPGGEAALQELTQNGMTYETVSMYRENRGNPSGPNGYSFDASIISSKSPGAHFTLGYYQGSAFDEGDISLNDYYYFAIPIEINIERTKDGYCTTDLTSLSSGHYLASIKSGSDLTKWITFEII